MMDASEVRWVSKYVRPVEFVTAHEEIEQPIKKQKSSNGDEVASLYKNIINSTKSSATPSPPPAKKTVWCESCEMTITEADYKRHIQGTAHMVSRKIECEPVDTLTLGGSNVGFRMLTSQGWKYKEGLGKEGQGRRHPIATVFKQDRLCIGHENSGRKVVTHTHQEIERKAIERQRKMEEQKKDPGKKIAKKAKAESRKRVAMLHYLKQ